MRWCRCDFCYFPRNECFQWANSLEIRGVITVLLLFSVCSWCLLLVPCSCPKTRCSQQLESWICWYSPFLLQPCFNHVYHNPILPLYSNIFMNIIIYLSPPNSNLCNTNWISLSFILCFIILKEVKKHCLSSLSEK